ncbi:ABC transporter permease [Streptomyces sp. NBC_00080]|uniref:ABC transporter permease n=1 Tax=unclassified Streptomyces TaxID=2593676 RepID=UPI001150522D|nr:ABC transporter permease [Streptomyces sp. SLBN-115]TQJ52609.1 peptide/nickel transport system permease protein [Streptomyces sp. SLBN-115]
MTDLTDLTKRRGAGGVETPAPPEALIPATTQWGDVRYRFLQNRLAVVGLVIVTLLVLVAVFGPWLAPQDPSAQDLMNTLAGPSAQHWMGTDALGRDLFSRLVSGTRIAMLVGFAAMTLSCFLGIAMGVLAGCFGRWADTLIMRTADIFFAFPLLIGAIAIMLVVGQGITPVIISLALFSWATIARLLRSSLLVTREMDYVHAARALGASRARIIRRHILPNSLTAVLVYATFNVGTAIVGVASLSFLGIGVAPGVPEWGNMLASGRGFVGVKDYLWLCPGFAIVLTVLGFVFVGDGLRDALDPKLR